MVFEDGFKTFQGFFEFSLGREDHTAFIVGDDEVLIELYGCGVGIEGLVGFIGEPEDPTTCIPGGAVLRGEIYGFGGGFEGVFVIVGIDEDESVADMDLRAGIVEFESVFVVGDGGVDFSFTRGFGGFDEEFIDIAEADFTDFGHGIFGFVVVAECFEDDGVELPGLGVVGILGEGGFDGFEGVVELT